MEDMPANTDLIMVYSPEKNFQDERKQQPESL